MIVINATVWPWGRNPAMLTRHEGDRYGDLEVLSLIIVNDGTGVALNPNDGGVGNYDVYEGDPRVDNYKRDTWKHIGRIENVQRDEYHRRNLIVRATLLAQEAHA